MTRSLLVTGGAGFIGANFLHYWAEHYPDDRLVVLDALTYAGHRPSLAALEARDAIDFVHGDICDQPLVETLLQRHRIDTIVHFAAESHVDRSITGPDAFVRTNVDGTHSLLKAARATWLSGDGVPHRFHHISTDEVYGTLGDEDPPFTEQHQYQPNSPYSASKAASDHLVRAYHHTYGLQVTTSNCSNNYGPLHFPEKLIPLAITNLLRGLKVPIYGNGHNVRDWLYVEDHARGIDAILQQGAIGETYNIGGNNEWRNIDLIKELAGQMDRLFAEEPEWAKQYPEAAAARGGSFQEQFEYVTDRAGHDYRYAIDAAKITKSLGFSPTIQFAEGAHRTVKWYLQNRDWWQPLLVTDKP